MTGVVVDDYSHLDLGAVGWRGDIGCANARRHPLELSCGLAMEIVGLLDRRTRKCQVVVWIADPGFNLPHGRINVLRWLVDDHPAAIADERVNTTAVGCNHRNSSG